MSFQILGFSLGKENRNLKYILVPSALIVVSMEYGDSNVRIAISFVQYAS